MVLVDVFPADNGRSKLRVTSFLACLIATCLLFGAEQASASLDVPIPVSSDQTSVLGPAVAHDSADTTVVAWVRASDNHVVARRVSADGALATLWNLSGAANASAAKPPVATADASGNVTVVWTRGSDQHVVAVRIPVGGAPGSVVDVSQTSVANAPVHNAATDGLGNVHFAWRRNSDSHVITRSLAPDGSLSGTTDVSAIDAEAALWGTTPGVAADAAGNRYFTWHRNTDCHIILRKLSSSGELGPAQDVSQTVDKAVGDTSPSVAVAGGNVLVVWHRDGDQYNHADDTVYSSFVPSGGSPGAPKALSAVGDVSMREIAAAGAPDGSFVVAWQQPAEFQVVQNTVSASGVVGLVQPVSLLASAPETSPAASVSTTGSRAFVWTTSFDNSVHLYTLDGVPPKPPEPDPPATVVKLVKSYVFLRGSVVTFKLYCAAKSSTLTKSGGNEGSVPSTKCYGKAKLDIALHKRTFLIKRGKYAYVSFVLSKPARRALRRYGRVKANLSLTTASQNDSYKLLLKAKRRR